MALINPVKDPPGPSSTPAPTPPTSKPPTPSTATATATPSTVKPEAATPSTPRPPPPPTPSSTDADVVHVPSYSRWFSWNDIHECEVRFLPEFFDSRSPSKNPRVYMYYRNSIIKQYRQNPSSKINFTDVRRTLVGDVGSIRRVFDFLDAWGLINYTPSSLNKPLKWEDKDSKSGQASACSADAAGDSAAPVKETSKKLCSGCKSVCSIACFVCDKYDLTLCARCYVRGNYRGGVTSSDFRRVEISEEARTDWTEKETLQLMEAIMHFGDDWKKVAQHVGGRTEKDCITHFIKLPFGEQFSGHTNSGEVNYIQTPVKDPIDGESGSDNVVSSPTKRMRLTPLADASNPIMAQVAFLSALAGSRLVEATAGAAVRTLTEVEYGASKHSLGSLVRISAQQGATVASNGDTNLDVLERACLDANSQLEKEELEVEKAISGIAEVKTKEILEKIAHFEELDLRMEKEWQQVEQMKNLLFVDQLTLLFHKSSAPNSVGHVDENVRTE